MVSCGLPSINQELYTKNFTKHICTHKTRPLTIQLQMMMKLTNTRLEPHFSHKLHKHAMVKMLTAFAFYRQKDRHVCPKTVRNAFQTPNTGSARQAPAQCQVQQSRSNVNASADPLISCYSELKNKMRSKNGPKSFFGVCQSVCFFMALKMVHILDLGLEATMFFFSQCWQNA